MCAQYQKDRKISEWFLRSYKLFCVCLKPTTIWRKRKSVQEKSVKNDFLIFLLLEIDISWVLHKQKMKVNKLKPEYIFIILWKSNKEKKLNFFWALLKNHLNQCV